MFFKQLFEESSCTYTYLIGCRQTRQCCLIDPVLETVARDLQVINELGLHLSCTLETHIHADHITGAYQLKKQVNSKIGAPAHDKLSCTDIIICEGHPIQVGQWQIHPLFTPGHTASHHCFLLQNSMQNCVFTGDALLIDACGRTDFQEGDPAQLYQSIHNKLFSLADETLVYPGHDYDGRFVSSIGQEKKRNPRLVNQTLEQFIQLMQSFDFPPPKKIDVAVPANQLCGNI